MSKIDFEAIIPKFDKLLERGLCVGVGQPDGQMCIEAAITQAMGLEFNDKPACVANAVRRYKIRLNDSPRWASPQSRAKGLRDLGIAQIGSKGIVDDVEFVTLMAKKTIKFILPEIPTRSEKLKALLVTCGAMSMDAPLEDFRKAAYAAYAAYAAACAAAAAADAAYAAAYAAAAAACAAADAAYAAAACAAADAACAADAADAVAAAGERILLLSASLALETLRELKSPGCEWI